MPSIERDIVATYLAAVKGLRATVRARLRDRTDFAAVAASLPVRAAYARMERPLALSFDRAAKAGMREAKGGAKVGNAGGFAPTEEEAVADIAFADQLAAEWSLTQAAGLVANITADQQAAIQEALAAGVRANETLPQIARRIEQTIGLSPRDARAVAKYGLSLGEQGMSVRAAETLVQKRVDQMVRRRARTIARTERKSAREAAKLAEWGAMVAEGEIPTDVLRKWVGRDPCPICVELARLGPIPLAASFVLASGRSFKRPPAHTNCRCVVVLVKARTPGPRPGWRLKARPAPDARRFPRERARSPLTAPAAPHADLLIT